MGTADTGNMGNITRKAKCSHRVLYRTGRRNWGIDRQGVLIVEKAGRGASGIEGMEDLDAPLRSAWSIALANALENADGDGENANSVVTSAIDEYLCKYPMQTPTPTTAPPTPPTPPTPSIETPTPSPTPSPTPELAEEIVVETTTVETTTVETVETHIVADSPAPVSHSTIDTTPAYPTKPAHHQIPITDTAYDSPDSTDSPPPTDSTTTTDLSALLGPQSPSNSERAIIGRKAIAEVFGWTAYDWFFKRHGLELQTLCIVHRTRIGNKPHPQVFAFMSDLKAWAAWKTSKGEII
jgi:hypothetical protein